MPAPGPPRTKRTRKSSGSENESLYVRPPNDLRDEESLFPAMDKDSLAFSAIKDVVELSVVAESCDDVDEEYGAGVAPPRRIQWLVPAAAVSIGL